MHRRPVLLATIILTGIPLVLSLACSRPQSVRAEKTSEWPTVAVAKATAENLFQGLMLTAEFKPFQEVDLMAKVAGYVKEIRVDVGDRVKQGQLLAILEIPEQANDLARAKAAVDLAGAEVPRARNSTVVRRRESAERGRSHAQSESLHG